MRDRAAYLETEDAADLVEHPLEARLRDAADRIGSAFTVDACEELAGDLEAVASEIRHNARAFARQMRDAEGGDDAE